MAQFDAEVLAAWQETFVLAVQYYAATLCTCLAKNNGVPDPRCPHCTLGWVYASPVAAEMARIAPNLRALPQEVATLFVGGARLTIPELLKAGTSNPAFVNIHRGDVVAISQFPERHSDILLRGTRDVLWAFDVQSVVVIRDEDGVVYTNTDYTLSGRSIVWAVGFGPAVGKFYTVEFVAPAQFLVYGDEPRHRGGDGTGAVLPKTVLAVRRTYQPPTTDHPLNAGARSLIPED